MTRLLIAGGGTGGHLFPGVATAEQLLLRDPNSELLFVGTSRGIEARIIPELGWNLACIDVSGLKTVGALGALRGSARLPRAMFQSRAILKSFRPNFVLGVGGYASGPVVLAASLMGIPTAILEQNSVPGLTNRILGRFVDRVFISFDRSQEFFRRSKSALVGNPIRQQIIKGLQQPPKGSRKDFQIFISGGSQGARSVNQMSCKALALLADQGLRPSIVHQTGELGLDATRQQYKQSGVTADCRAFIKNMAKQYQAADLIIARAGATTIAELGIVGKPAILVPYPHAANNHQEHNAGEMVEAGAALMLCEQGASDGQRLAALITSLMSDQHKSLAMATAMRALGKPDAATRVVNFVVDQSCKR